MQRASPDKGRFADVKAHCLLLLLLSFTTAAQEGAVSGMLSARQQAIPLIAASMASSKMAELDKALNQGLDAGLTSMKRKRFWFSYTPTPAFRAA